MTHKDFEALVTSFERNPDFPLSSETKGLIAAAAWEASLTAALPLVEAMLRRILRDEADVLKVLQQTALRATARRHQFRAEASLSTWLVAIALNEARQMLRKKKSQPLTVSLDFVDRDLWDRHIASPEERACQAQLNTRVRQAIGKLPLHFQTVVRLRDLEECSIEQTAQLLHLTPATVKSRHFRARHLLAEHYSQQHG